MMNWEIELTRNNVTPAKFFAEIRFACKKKGIIINYRGIMKYSLVLNY